MPQTLKIAKWSAKNFLALLRGLSGIPSHLYIEEKINFVVVEVTEKLPRPSGHTAFKECFCNAKEKPSVIIAENNINARGVVHDLVHKLADKSLGGLSQQLFQALSAKNFAELHQKLSHTTGQIDLGARNIREFFSVAAEYYIQGKDVFMKTYKKFLGEKDSEVLYTFMEEKIFLGRKAPN